MNFFVFLFYFLISSFVLILILFGCYRFFVKRKCNILSNTAEKAIDDYFNAFDHTIDDDIVLEHLDNSDIPMTHDSEEHKPIEDNLPKFF